MIKREEIRGWKKGTLSNPRMGHQGWVEQKKSLQEKIGRTKSDFAFFLNFGLHSCLASEKICFERIIHLNSFELNFKPPLPEVFL